jgi:hypothetical protein
VEVLCLVPLADDTTLHVIPHQSMGVRVEEGCVEPMQCLLGALVPDAMGRGQQLWPERGRGRHEHTTNVKYLAIHDTPSL